MLKRIVIIPGSCSSRSCWFDQIQYFESQDYQVEFVSLDAYKFKHMSECAGGLFYRLRSILDMEAEYTIVTHSMGAMLLYNILSQAKFYSARDKFTFDRILAAKVIFIQMPITVNRPLLRVMDIMKYLMYPFMFVYSLFFGLFDFIFVLLKNLVWHLPLLNVPLGFLLNLALMNHAFWGTKPNEFYNLVNYYRDWDNQLNISGPLDFEIEGDYHFITGQPDAFSDCDLIREMAQRHGFETVELPMGLHNPQHMFWTQERVNNLIMKSNVVV